MSYYLKWRIYPTRSLWISFSLSLHISCNVGFLTLSLSRNQFMSRPLWISFHSLFISHVMWASHSISISQPIYLFINNFFLLSRSLLKQPFPLTIYLIICVPKPCMILLPPFVCPIVALLFFWFFCWVEGIKDKNCRTKHIDFRVKWWPKLHMIIFIMGQSFGDTPKRKMEHKAKVTKGISICNMKLVPPLSISWRALSIYFFCKLRTSRDTLVSNTVCYQRSIFARSCFSIYGLTLYSIFLKEIKCGSFSRVQ